MALGFISTTSVFWTVLALLKLFTCSLSCMNFSFKPFNTQSYSLSNSFQSFLIQMSSSSMLQMQFNTFQILYCASKQLTGEKGTVSAFSSWLCYPPSQISTLLFLGLMELLKLDLSLREHWSIAFKLLLIIFSYFLRLFSLRSRNELRLQYSFFFFYSPYNSTPISKFFYFKLAFSTYNLPFFSARFLSCSQSRVTCSPFFSSQILILSLAFSRTYSSFLRAMLSSQRMLPPVLPSLAQQNCRVYCSSVISSFFSAISSASISKLYFFFLLYISCLRQFSSICISIAFFSAFKLWICWLRVNSLRDMFLVFSLREMGCPGSKQETFLRGQEVSKRAQLLDLSWFCFYTMVNCLFLLFHRRRIASRVLREMQRSKVCATLNPLWHFYYMASCRMASNTHFLVFCQICANLSKRRALAKLL